MPGAQDLEEFWATLCRGRSLAAPITAWDATKDPVTFACEVTEFDLDPYITPREARRLDRVSHFAWAAAADAIADAGPLNYEPERSAVICGTAIGGQRTQGNNYKHGLDKGLRYLTPFLIPMVMPNASAGLISVNLGWKGPSICTSMACASGSYAIGEGVRLLRDGSADVVVAGGSESMIERFVLGGFSRAGAMSRRNESPAEACRPFDADRDGFVMGEGAAFVVLERLDAALARGARIYALLAGYGRNSDGYHLTLPAPNGSGAAACMELALADANMEPADIGHVNAHGTATHYNDASEADAIAKVFGPGSVPVTAIKSIIGHLISGSGAAELVASVLSMNHEMVPPTANFAVTDGVDIDIVSGAPRPLASAPVISNSFAFGGHNASLVVKPVG